jgi:hypothetical protein
VNQPSVQQAELELEEEDEEEDEEEEEEEEEEEAVHEEKSALTVQGVRLRDILVSGDGFARFARFLVEFSGNFWIFFGG